MATKMGLFVRRHAFGLIAIFIALGGTAYALERNSVRSKHIVNGQVKAADQKPARQVEVAPSTFPDNDPCAAPAPRSGVFCGDDLGAWLNQPQFVPPHSPAAFDIDNEGLVQIRGMVAPTGFSPTTIFVLPPRYRPNTQRLFTTTAHYNLDGGYDIARIDVLPNGRVNAVGIGDLTGSGDYLSLDGIIFRAGT